MKVLFAVKENEPDYMEQLITEKEERFEGAKKWCKDNGFNRFRIAEIDMSKKPDFIKTITTSKK
jgi:hypothetical protein